MDWDDLRFILSVYDNGSALAAAQQMGVNASTVQRRIGKFETQNNIRLFERLQSGYRPTPECEVLIKETREIDERITGLKRKLLGRDSRLEGRLAVTSTETFVDDLVARHLDDFHQLYPNIEIELTLTSSRLNLSNQDADIAIRPSLGPQDTLVGRHVADLGFGIYGTPEIIASLSLPKSPTLKDLANQKWLGVGATLSGSPSHKWMHENIPSSSIWLYLDTYSSMAVCTAQSIGLAVLPCIVADPMPQIQRLKCSWFQLSIPVWVLTHPEIRNAARIRVFMNYISSAMKKNRAALIGY